MKKYEYENLVKIFFDDGTNMSFSRKKYGELLDLIIKQVTEEKMKIRNPYKVNEDGSITMLYLNQKTNSILEFLIDYDDWLKYREQYWTIYSSGYVVSRTTGRKITLHRDIMGLGDFTTYKEVVDHLNHNKLDNRKSNLRIVTQKENNHNASFELKSSKGTGIRGICKCTNWKNVPKGSNYRVRIKKLDGTYFLKYTETLEDAIDTLLKIRKENGFYM